jgi:hypothetical protein
LINERRKALKKSFNEGVVDDMIYELYGLSEEEVRVVEESLK